MKVKSYSGRHHYVALLFFSLIFPIHNMHTFGMMIMPMLSLYMLCVRDNQTTIVSPAS